MRAADVEERGARILRDLATDDFDVRTSRAGVTSFSTIVENGSLLFTLVSIQDSTPSAVALPAAGSLAA